MIATTRVALTVDLELPSRWNTDCNVQYIRDQAVKEALASLNRLLDASRDGTLMINGCRSNIRGTVVGVPKVTVVVISDEVRQARQCSVGSGQANQGGGGRANVPVPPPSVTRFEANPLILLGF